MNSARLFAVHEANALVPRLNELFTQVRADSEHARKIASALAERGHPVQPDAPVELDANAPAAIQALQRELRERCERVTRRLTEVNELGAEVKAIDGLVDFQSRLHGQIVYLCWRYPETEITTWHEIDAGFIGRQPVANPADFEGDYLQ